MFFFRYLSGRGLGKRHTLAVTYPTQELAEEVKLRLMQQPFRRRTCGLLSTHERSPRMYISTSSSTELHISLNIN